jgi:hypothetical protein
MNISYQINKDTVCVQSQKDMSSQDMSLEDVLLTYKLKKIKKKAKLGYER